VLDAWRYRMGQGTRSFCRLPGFEQVASDAGMLCCLRNMGRAPRRNLTPNSDGRGAVCIGLG